MESRHFIQLQGLQIRGFPGYPFSLALILKKYSTSTVCHPTSSNSGQKFAITSFDLLFYNLVVSNLRPSWNVCVLPFVTTINGRNASFYHHCRFQMGGWLGWLSHFLMGVSENGMYHHMAILIRNILINHDKPMDGIRYPIFIQRMVLTLTFWPWLICARVKLVGLD